MPRLAARAHVSHVGALGTAGCPCDGGSPPALLVSQGELTRFASTYPSDRQSPLGTVCFVSSPSLQPLLRPSAPHAPRSPRSWPAVLGQNPLPPCSASAPVLTCQHFGDSPDAPVGYSNDAGTGTNVRPWAERVVCTQPRAPPAFAGPGTGSTTRAAGRPAPGVTCSAAVSPSPCRAARSPVRESPVPSSQGTLVSLLPIKHGHCQFTGPRGASRGGAQGPQ